MVLLLAGGVGGPQGGTVGASEFQPTSFEDLKRRASEAREAGRLDGAADLYRDALRAKPDWPEGWWYMGAMAYERDRFRECRDAFRELLRLEPEAAPAWALRGLCEFQLKEYDTARRHLDEALSVGPLGDESLGRVVAYHQALLLIKDFQFDRAIAPLTRLLQSQSETPELVEACGLALLRRPALPSEVPASDRDLLQAAGRAYCAHLARKGAEARALFEELLARYPGTRHLHYGYGLALAQQGSTEALAQFRREIALHPDHVLAHIELAFNLLARGETSEARTVAEIAVRLDPELFASHLALGRALVAEGNLTLGIFELETAARLAPGVPETYLALARAYAQAGREEDAAGARAVFRQLEAARRQRPAGPAGQEPREGGFPGEPKGR